MSPLQRLAWPATLAVSLGLAHPAVVGAQSTRASPAQSAWSSAVRSAIEARISSGLGLDGTPLAAAETGQLRALYAGLSYGSLWTDEAGHPRLIAHEAIGLLSRAASDGLDPQDYHAERLGRLIAALEDSNRPTPSEAAAFEVTLTRMTATYLRHLHSGRVDPEVVEFRMSVPPDHHDFAALLSAAVQRDRLGEVVSELTPPLLLYRDLRAALTHYRSLAAGVELDSLPAVPTSVKPGASYAGLRALHHQLVLLGDLPPGAPPPADGTPYESGLVEGVKRFQGRHGLEQDGVIGEQTFTALRVPLSWRVRQIELSLERLRWVPHVDNGPGILVNIPTFRLWAWDSLTAGDLPSFETGVIVGRALRTRTPVFDDELRYLILRPYWNVPPSIVKGEILPALAERPDYLEREHMEIVSGPGDDAVPVPTTPDTIDRLRLGLLRLRQQPGPTNALGLMKFVFPNDEAVYLHDTPGRALFRRSRRDFSHGCVRVQDPVGLALFALGGDPAWTRETLDAAMHGPDSHRVDLDQPVQMILFYLTAVVAPRERAIQFADDIYGHDQGLDRALGATSRPVL